jgi:DNA-binding PadR family transcriptional regulator
VLVCTISVTGGGAVVLAKVDLLVLGFLAEGPLHGYDLLERLRERAVPLWAGVGRASVYQALARLEGRGLLAGRDVAGVEGPDRRVYRLTRRGREELRRALVERLALVGPYEAPAWPAPGLLHLLSPPDARAAVAERERALRGLLERLGEARGRIRDGSSRRMLELQEALVRAELGALGVPRSARRS